jgi:AbrB family looped-hinge helix DNA binding protein
VKTQACFRDTSKVGKRGTVVLPARLRRRFGIQEGDLVVVESVPEGVLIRPAVALPIEVYTPQRQAEFLLNNAVDAADYRAARAAVRAMGLDPDTIDHKKPPRA